MKIILWGFCLLIAGGSFAQPDTTTLLKEAETKLSVAKTNVSEILSEKKFLPIHPLTSFRQLIKQHAQPLVLKIVTDEEPGTRIKVILTVNNNAGQPIPNALVYLYQTDSRGWYAADAPHVLAYEGDIRHARLFGYALTDKNGVIELHTVKPKGYPSSDLPAHIHVHVMAQGYRNAGTEFLFDDDDRLQGEIRQQAIRNGFMIAKPEKSPPAFAQQFSYIIKLEK